MNIRFFFRRSIFLVAIGSVAGCSTFPIEQSARTLKPKISEVGVSTALVNFSPANSRVSGFGPFTGDAKPISADFAGTYEMIVPTIYYRLGILKHFDAEIRLQWWAQIYLGTKYEFFDSGPFAMAGGFAYRANNLATGGEVLPQSVEDFIFPLYMNYDISPRYTVYLSPRYVLRATSGGSPANSVGNLALLGGGVKIGNKIGVYFEASYGKDLTSSLQLYEASVAFFLAFPWKKM